MKPKKFKSKEISIKWIFNPFEQTILGATGCKCSVKDPVLPCIWVTDYLVVVKPPKK